MGKTKKLTRNQNCGKKVKTCDNGGGGLWADLNHDLLYIILMQLGTIDYLSFSGVCKSWRTLAISNKSTFMATKPPLTLQFNRRLSKIPCSLQDFEGKNLNTVLPRFAGGSFVGLTCGYLIFFKRNSRVFRLVNPITMHELHFCNFPLDGYNFPSADRAKAILVYSRSLCGWVFLVIRKGLDKIWFFVATKKKWDCVLCAYPFSDLITFKGKIYTLNYKHDSHLCDRLHELRLTPKPKLTLLVTKNSLNRFRFSSGTQLVSSGDNLYVMERVPLDMDIDVMVTAPKNHYIFRELDFGEMKWVQREKTIGQSASFLSNVKHSVAVTSEYILQGHDKGEMLKLMKVKKTKGSVDVNMWYFPHESLDVGYID